MFKCNNSDYLLTFVDVNNNDECDENDDDARDDEAQLLTHLLHIEKPNSISWMYSWFLYERTWYGVFLSEIQNHGKMIKIKNSDELI